MRVRRRRLLPQLGRIEQGAWRADLEALGRWLHRDGDQESLARLLSQRMHNRDDVAKLLLAQLPSWTSEVVVALVEDGQQLTILLASPAGAAVVRQAAGVAARTLALEGAHADHTLVRYLARVLKHRDFAADPHLVGWVCAAMQHGGLPDPYHPFALLFDAGGVPQRVLALVLPERQLTPQEALHVLRARPPVSNRGMVDVISRTVTPSPSAAREVMHALLAPPIWWSDLRQCVDPAFARDAGSYPLALFTEALAAASGPLRHRLFMLWLLVKPEGEDRVPLEGEALREVAIGLLGEEAAEARAVAMELLERYAMGT